MLKEFEREINGFLYKISYDDGRYIYDTSPESTDRADVIEYFISGEAKKDFQGKDFYLLLPFRSGFMRVTCTCLSQKEKAINQTDD